MISLIGTCMVPGADVSKYVQEPEGSSQIQLGCYPSPMVGRTHVPRFQSRQTPGLMAPRQTEPWANDSWYLATAYDS